MKEAEESSGAIETECGFEKHLWDDGYLWVMEDDGRCPDTIMDVED